MSFTAAPPTASTYAPPPAHYQPQHSAQVVYYSAPLAPLPPILQQIVHQYNPAPPQTQQYRPLASRTPQSAQRAPALQGQQGGMQPRPRAQYTPLPVPLSHDQTLRCEYHSGAPDHTIDNCWKLREEVQKMIDANKISFNAIRSSNVQVNPLPDHGASSGPTINMISVCTVREQESKMESSPLFVIECVLAKTAVGFTRSTAVPAPFIIEVLARESYQVSAPYFGPLAPTNDSSPKLRLLFMTRADGGERADLGAQTTEEKQGAPKRLRGQLEEADRQ
ncbi:hypothetical protein CRG98_017077 [Punica granatum]|uniref:Uncharacterized protein n=1 Tax=Punica granatum TaxID=22663 RepID=A0A2I0K1U9_PUNGR|nr:hypothetical protein CRG98_017077 [Punica granatum]